MKPGIPDIISLAVKELENNLVDIIRDRLKKIILYGSFSRSDYEKGSDVDVLILADLPELELIELNKKLDILSTDLSLKYNIVLSPILKNINTFSKYSGVLPFYKNIIKEGKVLYG